MSNCHHGQVPDCCKIGSHYMQTHGVHVTLRFHSAWRATGWVFVVAVVYLSLTPQPVPIPVEQGDKFGHLAAYAGLMLWFSQLYSSTRERMLLASGLVALGIGLEFAQLLTATRMFELADMAANSAGVAIGWIAAPPRTLNFLKRIESAIR